MVYSITGFLLSPCCRQGEGQWLRSAATSASALEAEALAYRKNLQVTSCFWFWRDFVAKMASEEVLASYLINSVLDLPGVGLRDQEHLKQHLERSS